MKSPSLRSAFTLLEMILVLAVVGVFLAMGASLLYGYARLHTNGARNLDAMTQWREMADTWRRDVRLSSPAPPLSGRPINSASEITLNPDGQLVIWKIGEDKVVRMALPKKLEKSWTLGQGKGWAEFGLLHLDKNEVLVFRHGENKINGKFVQGEYTALRGGDLP